MELFERDEALEALEYVRAAAFAGRGATVLVGGPVGVGKSALLDTFIGRAADAGGLLLTAVGSEAERSVPLGVLTQLLFGTPLPDQDREVLAAVVVDGAEAMAELASRVPGPGTTGDPDAPGGRLSPLQAEIAERFCAVLVALAARRPVAVVVDDAHLADPASLACLGYLVRRVRDVRIAVVVSHADAATWFRAAVLRQPRSREIELMPLTRAGVADLLAARLPAGQAERYLEGCFRIGGGNPLLTRGLCEDLRDAARAVEEPVAAAIELAAGPESCPVGEGFVRAVLDFLRRAEPRSALVAQGVAVLGGPGPLDRLLELDASVEAAAVRALERAGLLESRAFRHPAAIRAVLADLDPAVRAELHERAAEIGYAEGWQVCAVAEHLRAARRARADWAVPLLDAAAHQALSEGRVAIAVEYLRLACERCTDDAQRARLKTTLARAEWRSSPTAPSRHFDDLLELMAAGHLPGRDAALLAKALLWHGRADDATRVLVHLAESRPRWDPETVIELSALRPWLRTTYPPLLEHLPEVRGDAGGHPRLDFGAGADASPASAAAGSGAPSGSAAGRGRAAYPQLPAAGGDLEARGRIAAITALHRVLSKGPSQQLVEEAERILTGARLDGMAMDTVESALLALTYADQPQRAAPWCDALIRQAAAGEAPSRHARLSAIRAEICLRQGDLAGTELHARSGFELLPHDGWGVTVGGCLGSLLTALTAMGRHEEAAALLDRPVPEAIVRSRFGLHYVRARGRHSLATRDYGGALTDFEYCGDVMRRWDLDVPGLIAWRNDLAEVYLRIGDHERARRLLKQQLKRSDRCVSPRAHGTALRLLAGSYRQGQRPTLLRQAADILQASGDRFGLALALCDLTAAYEGLGETRRARVIGWHAWNLAVECGAEPLLGLLAAYMPKAGDEEGTDVPAETRGFTVANGIDPDEDPSDSLTAPLSDAERRVAALVVMGYTNREVSLRLSITISTVEQHLTRIYRKIGVSGRADLAVALSAGLLTAGA